VIAIGYQYNTEKWALRAGYNYGKAPIENLVETLGATPGTPDFRNTGSNYFNAVGFPASVEQHFTFGGSYKFSQNMALDLAFTFAPEDEIQYNVTNMTGCDPVTTTHSQTALTAGMHFSF
jgi:long-chain fatty acid transport protein